MATMTAAQRRERNDKIVEALRDATGEHDMNREWGFCLWENLSPGWCHECDEDTSDIVGHILTAHRG